MSDKETGSWSLKISQFDALGRFSVKHDLPYLKGGF